MDNELRSLVEIQKAFSRHSVQLGIRDAFLTYLSEQGIIFDPRPVNGREMYAKREESPGTLIWWPVRSAVEEKQAVRVSSGKLVYGCGNWYGC